MKNQNGSRILYENLVTKIEGTLGAEWEKVVKSQKLRKETVFRGEKRPIVQAILQMAPPAVYVLVLPAGVAREGFTGRIPSLDDFIHPK